ncbi:putative immunogenic protein NIP-3 [Ditylenchus destructor]|nr:putative immunogenic protein NIP-3 [Ditylenchus destructor]
MDLFVKAYLPLCLVLLAILNKASDACRVLIKAQSVTNTPFKLQILIPAINAETEQVFFEKPSRKKVMIDGPDCMAQHWKFITFKTDEAGNWIPAKEGTARLDGMGEIMVNVDEDLLPHIGERLGVACSESVICG